MDRRLFSRIQISGATVQYKKTRVNILFSALSKPQDISNLSKSGLSFEIDKKMGFGDKIQMRLAFPDGKYISLKGHIRWNNSVNSSTGYEVGIQFFPFGTSNNYNHISALDYLRSLDGLGQFCMNPE